MNYPNTQGLHGEIVNKNVLRMAPILIAFSLGCAYARDYVNRDEIGGVIDTYLGPDGKVRDPSAGDMTADRTVVRSVFVRAWTPLTSGAASSDAIEVEKDGKSSLMVVRRKFWGGLELATLATEYDGPRIEDWPEGNRAFNLGRGPQGRQFWIIEAAAATGRPGRANSLSGLAVCDGPMCAAARWGAMAWSARPGVSYRSAFTSEGISDDWFPILEESATGDWLYSPVVVGSGPAIVLEPRDVEFSISLPVRPVLAQASPVLRASMRMTFK